MAKVDPEKLKNLELPEVMIDAPVPLDNWLVILPVILLLGGGALLLTLRSYMKLHLPIAFLLVAAAIAAELVMLERVMTSGPMNMTMGDWIAPFGISFTADTFGVLLSLAAAVTTLIILAYTAFETNLREIKYGYFSLILLMLAGVSGAFLTGDLFNLYVWFEVVLISSFGLLTIGGRRKQLDGAVKYGFLNFLATTIFLIATGLLYGVAGTLNMADLIVVVSNTPEGVIDIIALLFIVAFAMKGASFPLNFWLGASYHTPRPGISALFAGLLTKVGIYALVRVMYTLLADSNVELSNVVFAIAALSLILAPLAALAQTDMRRALGFILIGGVGSMIAGLAIGTDAGIWGSVTYMVHSMLTMAGLYMVAGVVERAASTSDMSKMGGFYAKFSLVSILFLVLVFTVAGLPPFLGIWPKFLLVQAALDAEMNLMVFLILANGLLTSIAGGRMWAHVFLRAGPQTVEDGTQDSEFVDAMAEKGRKPHWGLMAPTAVLVAVTFAIGVWPQPLIDASKVGANQLTFTKPYVEVVLGEGALERNEGSEPTGLAPIQVPGTTSTPSEPEASGDAS